LNDEDSDDDDRFYSKKKPPKKSPNSSSGNSPVILIFVNESFRVKSAINYLFLFRIKKKLYLKGIVAFSLSI
jgi:hypothetical protein